LGTPAQLLRVQLGKTLIPAQLLPAPELELLELEEELELLEELEEELLEEELLDEEELLELEDELELLELEDELLELDDELVEPISQAPKLFHACCQAQPTPGA